VSRPVPQGDARVGERENARGIDTVS